MRRNPRVKVEKRWGIICRKNGCFCLETFAYECTAQDTAERYGTQYEAVQLKICYTPPLKGAHREAQV